MSGDAPRIRLADLPRIVSDGGELAKGALFADGGGLEHLARVGRRVFAEARGGQATAYRVSLQLAEGGKVTAQCTCMAARSRPFCKHGAALLVTWARSPEAFAVAEAPPEGAVKRARSVRRGKRDQKEALARGAGQAITLVRALAAAGVASRVGERTTEMRALAGGLRDLGLRRLAGRVVDAANLLDAGAPPGVRWADLVSDLLLSARKVERHAAGEPLDDRLVEELIGKTWRKGDRRVVEGLTLVEYAYRMAETADKFVVRESRFVDPASGAHWSEKQILPGFLARRTEPKRSHAGRVLSGVSATVFPGYPPERLELTAIGGSRLADDAALADLVARLHPGAAAALAAYQAHRRDVFAPRRLPVGLRITGWRDRRLVDAAGDALAVPPDPAAGQALDAAAAGGALEAVLGDLDLRGGLPVLRPLAVVVARPDGRLLVPLPFGGVTDAPAESDQAAAAGAPAQVVSLAEIREELGDLLVAGLEGASPRRLAPIAARLRTLGLERLAVAAEALAGDEQRLEAFVRLHHALGAALLHAGTVLGAPPETAVEIRPLPPPEVLAAQDHAGWADGALVPRLARGEAPGAEAALRSPWRLARATAAAALGREPGHERTLLEVARNDPDRLVRARAREALAARSGDPELRRLTEVRREHAAELVARLVAGSRAEVKIAAIQGLVEAGELLALPVLRAAYLADPGGDVGGQAAAALAELGDIEMTEAFLARAADPDRHIADVAIWVLGRLGDVRALPWLLARYQEGGRRAGAVAAALAQLGAGAVGAIVGAVLASKIAARPWAFVALAGQPAALVAGALAAALQAPAEPRERVARARNVARLLATDAAAETRAELARRLSGDLAAMFR